MRPLIRSAFVLSCLFVVVCRISPAAEKASPSIKEWQIKGMRAALKDGYPDVRARALQEISKLFDPIQVSHGKSRGWEGRAHELVTQAIPDVESLLREEDPVVRAAAAVLLGRLGERAKDSVPRLTEMLKDRDSRVRYAAIGALGMLQEDAREAIPELINRLQDEYVYVSTAAANALTSMREYAKEYVPNLKAQLHSANPTLRATAAYALGALGQDANEVTPQLVKLLSDSDSSVSSAAAWALITPPAGGTSQLGATWVNSVREHAKGAIPELLRLLKSDSVARDRAANALGGLGEHAKGAVPELLKMLGDNDPIVRQSAATVLGLLGEHAGESVPRLLEVLEMDSSARANASWALIRQGKHAKDAVPKLLEFLQHNEPQVQFEAVAVLGGLGEHAESAVPKLLELLRDHESETVRSQAARTLRLLGVHAKAAAPELERLLNNDRPDMRSKAAETLSALGGEHAERAVPKLIELLKDSEPVVRVSATAALNTLGEHARGAVPALIERLEDSFPLVRSNAAWALRGLAEYAEGAVPELDKLLLDPDPITRANAAAALGELGEHASGSIPKLHQLLLDSNNFAREAARQALMNIPPPSIIVFLEVPYVNTAALYEARWLGHYWGRGEKENETWCEHLGHPKTQPQLPAIKSARLDLLNEVGNAFDRSQSKWLREDAALWAAHVFASPGTDWSKGDLNVVKQWVERLDKEQTDPRLTSQLPEMRRIRDRLEDRFAWLKSLLVVVGILGFTILLLLVLPDLGGVEKWIPLPTYFGLGLGSAAGAHWVKLPLSWDWFLGAFISFVALALVIGLFSTRFLRELSKLKPLNFVALAMAHMLPWSRRRIFSGCRFDTAAQLSPTPRKHDAGEDLPYFPLPASCSQGSTEHLATRPAEKISSLLCGPVDMRGHILIEAPPGRGKTVLLNEIVRKLLKAYDDAPCSCPLPVFLTAGEGGIVERAEQALGDALVAPEMLGRYLREGWFVLVVDNVGESDLSADEITEFHQQYRGRTPLLLAARPNLQLHDAVGGKAKTWVVEPALLDDQTLDKFEQHCIQHLGGQPLSDERKQSCRGPAGFVPFFVRLAVVLGSESNARSAVDLFQEYLFRQCRDRNAMTDGEKQQLLRGVGRFCLKTYWVTGQRTWTFEAADVLQSRLMNARIIVPDRQTSSSQAMTKSVRFLHDSMQAYFTAEALVEEYDRQPPSLERPTNDPTSTSWDRARLLLWAAANPCFAGTESNGLNELWDMFLTIFPDRDAIQIQLQREIVSLGRRFRNYLGDPEDIKSLVPAEIEETLQKTFDPNDTPTFMNEAALACGEADRRNHNVVLLGRMYASLATLVFQRRLKSDVAQERKRKQLAAADSHETGEPARAVEWPTGTELR